MPRNLTQETDMKAINIWESDWGTIDMAQFAHLKYRKDGGFVFVSEAAK